MTTEPRIRYVSVSQYHVAAHAVRGRQDWTVCGVELDHRQVERMEDRVTCQSCLNILGTEQVPA